MPENDCPQFSFFYIRTCIQIPKLYYRLSDFGSKFGYKIYCMEALVWQASDHLYLYLPKAPTCIVVMDFLKLNGPLSKITHSYPFLKRHLKLVNFWYKSLEVKKG